LFPLFDTGGNTSGTGGKICRRCHRYGSKLAIGVVDTGSKFATSGVDTGGAPLFANIFANFRKNLN
jgi:hypothetical protein